MTGDPQTDRPDDVGRLENRLRLARARAMTRARLVVFWERLWPRLWPAVAIIAGALGVFLTDLLPVLPAGLHWGVLVAVGLAGLWAARHALSGVAVPGDEEVLRRIDRDSGLRHAPLVVLDDGIDPLGSSPEAQTLWAAHRRRMLAAVRRLRVAWPAPGLARHDPAGLRALGFLLLVIGLVAGAGDPFGRIVRALSPNGGDTVLSPAQVDVWLTPPAYTGLAPFYLAHNEGAEPVAEGSSTGLSDRAVPPGSRIIAQVGVAADGDVPGHVTLVLGERSFAFDPIGAGGYQVNVVLDESGDETGDVRLSVRRDEAELAGWPVRLVADAPPTIAYTRPPSVVPGGRLRIGFRAEDDFGVARAHLLIRNPALEAAAEREVQDRLDLPLPRTRARTLETAVVQMTADHDWAGLPVELRLEAVDAKGAVSVSEPVAMTLPERTFNHPVSRALVAFRKALVVPDDETVREVLDGLDNISRFPQPFGDALSAYLGVRAMRFRLTLDRDEAQIPAVRALMWLFALRLEEGAFAIAGRALMDSHEQVMEALRNGRFDDRTNRLLDELQQALDRYMDALNEQLARQGLEGLSDIPGMEYVERKDLRQMLDDARALARSGQEDAAERMLQQLAQMLEQLQQAMTMEVDREQLEAARRILEQLADMSREQASLLDETFGELRRLRGLDDNPVGEDGSERQDGRGENARARHGRPNGGAGADESRSPAAGAGRLAGPQESLRDRLNAMMQVMNDLMGDVPASVADAERAMNRAGEALRANDPGRAVPSQTDALELLRQTTEGMIRMMTQSLSSSGGGPVPTQGNRFQPGGDPFGRMGNNPPGSGGTDGVVEIPDFGDVMRSRRVYDELRRRAGERHRPRHELDYLERLLTPF